MRTVEDLRCGCAKLLRDLRQEKGLSMAKMADIMGVNPHTYARYESGESAPDVAEFIFIFERLHVSALRRVLDFLYPNVYGEKLNQNSDIEQTRDAVIHFFRYTASETILRESAFFLFGNHGSNYYAQFQEVTALNHLPMEYRYTVAEMVYMFWALSKSKGDLTSTSDIMPDIDAFVTAVNKGREAAINGNTGYTTIDG